MVRKLANECLAVAVNAVLVNKKQENWLLFFIVIKINVLSTFFNIKLFILNYDEVLVKKCKSPVLFNTNQL